MTTMATEKLTIPEGTWHLDPVHSSVSFRVADLSQAMTFVNGRFTDFAGTIVGGDEPTAEGVIRTESVTTDQEQRDAHLRSPDFFDAAQFPEIRFRSTAIETTGDETLRIVGKLTLAGADRELVLDGRVLGAGEGNGGERLVVEARGVLAFGPMRVELGVDASALRA
jgi:polyisoprenoid-binding protein YceI